MCRPKPREGFGHPPEDLGVEEAVQGVEIPVEPNWLLTIVFWPKQLRECLARWRADDPPQVALLGNPNAEAVKGVLTAPDNHRSGFDHCAIKINQDGIHQLLQDLQSLGLGALTGRRVATSASISRRDATETLPGEADRGPRVGDASCEAGSKLPIVQDQQGQVLPAEVPRPSSCSGRYGWAPQPWISAAAHEHGLWTC